MYGLLDILILACLRLFAQSKIAKFDMSPSIYQHIIRLDIPMYIILLMYALDGQDNLRCKELSLFLLKHISQYEQIHEISTSQVIHDQIQIILILEGVEQFNDPFSSICQDIPFCFEMALLILLYHLFLLQTLNRHYPPRLLLFTQSDLSKCPAADHTNRLEVFLADLLSSLPEILHLMLYDILLGIFPLIDGEVQLLDLLLKHLPMFTPLLLLESVEVVLPLDVSLDLLCFLFGRLAYQQVCFHYYSVINAIQ